MISRIFNILNSNLIRYVSYHQISWHISCTHQKNHELPEDGQELRPKHVRAIINK